MQALPLWLLGAVEQANRDADAGQLPVVVLCAVTPGKPARRLLVMDLDALMTWPGPAGYSATSELPE